MNRIRTQADFIERATEIHGNKYDYSRVVYVKSSEKVKIVCPIHGEFEQTPNKHLAGQGCSQCGRVRTKLGHDEFISRAKAVHGNRYDYSKVQYERVDKKVIIICPDHGEFLQTPRAHVVHQQNCPKCAAVVGGKKRMGDNNPMRQESTKQKVRETCIEKYGTKTYAESDEGRKKLHDIITSDDVQQRTIQTCMDRYGTKTWTQSDEGRERLHEIMSSEETQSKVRQGYLDAYGVEHYMKTGMGRARARECINSRERRLAIQAAFVKKYGTTNALSVPSIRAKICETNLLRYGVPHVGSCKFIHAKSWQTKRRNGTFSTSRPEDTLYGLLCDKFGRENVVRQYMDDRYPFHCDFYISTLDLFIELNANWTHGGHWFDSNNPLDLEKLACWQDRVLHQGSQFYKSAIHVWTVTDIKKRETAMVSNLNYLVFWDNNLTDAKAWLESL